MLVRGYSDRDLALPASNDRMRSRLMSMIHRRRAMRRDMRDSVLHDSRIADRNRGVMMHGRLAEEHQRLLGGRIG